MTRRVSLALTLAVAAMPLAAFGQGTPTNTDEPLRPAVAAPAPPRLPETLTPVAGGLTNARVGDMAIRASALVRAAHANAEAADAARSEAGLAMIPQLTVSARYTRLSEVNLTNPFASLSQLGALTSRLCVGQGGSLSLGAATGCPPGTAAAIPSSGGSSSNSNSNPFQPIYDQFAFRGTIAVPITDIPFRLARLYEAAGLTREARRFDEEATRAQAATDGRIAFYEYMRALGQSAVTSQGVEAAQRHREELARFVAAGTVARVELLRVEAQVAEAERLAILAREGASVAEAQLRIRINYLHGEAIRLGESLEEDVSVAGDVRSFIDHGWRSRPELASLNRQADALGANLAAVRAGYFPSVVAQANIDVANPNQRITPQVAEFNTTWDATLQVQWSPSAAIQAGATASRMSALRDAVRAQLDATLASVELDVRSAWTQVQAARASLEAARRQVTAAEESYRVRRERFNAGSAVSSDLTDAELDLLRGRLALVNANVDLREGLVRLLRASGSETP